MDRRSATRIVVGLVAAVSLVTAVARTARWRAGEAPADAAAPPPERAAPAWLRAFVTTRFNPVVIRLGLVGGRRSPWAYLEHVGRRSGIARRTPVLPMLVGDHVFVPLAYGTDVDWARNVRKAGHCRLQRHGTVLELDEPAVIPASEHPGLPGGYRTMLERRGRRYLRLHVLSAVPGELATEAVATVAVEHPLPARTSSAGPGSTGR